MKYIVLIAVCLLTGCATVQRPNYGYMVPMCQQFHDRGQFDLWAQCSQSVRNIEGQIGQTIIKSIIR